MLAKSGFQTGQLKLKLEMFVRVIGIIGIKDRVRIMV